MQVGFTTVRKFLLKVQTQNLNRKLQEAVFIKIKKKPKKPKKPRREYLHFYKAKPKKSAVPVAYRSFHSFTGCEAKSKWVLEKMAAVFMAQVEKLVNAQNYQCSILTLRWACFLKLPLGFW